jgi:predicted nucleotidyltransferase
MEDFNTEKPAYEKRFQIPEDEEIQERLKGVQHTVKAFQREYPEALSFSMYGSMVKDTATLESDVDGTLFIDTTPTGDEELDESVLERLKSGEYLSTFKSDLQERLGLTEEQVGKDVKLETISEQDVSTAAEKFILSNDLYTEEKKLWESTRRDTGMTEEGMFGEVKVYEYEGEEPVAPDLPNNIKAMFNMDVGGGVQKYREQFINSLEQLESEKAKDICRSISAYISFTEGGKRKEAAKLPNSFEEFKKRYT